MPSGSGSLNDNVPANTGVPTYNWSLASNVASAGTHAFWEWGTKGDPKLETQRIQRAMMAVLIASGYNAGPGRPRRWITEFGDPRRPEVDVVDWVESIPFGETRTYVMRVVEGVVIYRAKLKGAVGPVRITDELKG